MSENNIMNDRHLSDVLIMSERLALLYYHTVKNLVEEVGEEKAETLIRKIIYEYGKDCGERARSKVESLGEQAVIENYHLSNDLPSVGWEKEAQEFENKSSSGAKTTFCPFAHVWKNLDFEKWGRLYCYVDQAKYEGYNENLQCFHDKNLLDGDECCIIRVQNTDTMP